MNLPDFHYHKLFNQLRQKMGAKLIEMSKIPWNTIDTDEFLKRLNSLDGIIIDNIHEIEIKDDGTFEYRGQKVLIYIRDQRYDPSYEKKEYKYHICNCEVIDRFIQNNRFDRYVVSTRNDGKFLVNIKNTATNAFIEQNVIKELKVCKKCLEALNFNNYSFSSRENKNKIYNNFDLKDFFNQYNTQHSTKPTYMDTNAPADLYSEEFEKKSLQIRKKNNWTCEKCGIKLKPEHHHFLHVHHINGVKSDDRPTNLMCLCIKCHSEQPDHDHLKYNDDYIKFIALYQ
jgi:hypothetical protein